MSNITINSQYIKDLSFEVPSAPQVFLRQLQKPNIGINIDIDAKKIGQNNVFEVVLKIKADAVSKASEEQEIKVFICEVAYAGIFTIDEKIQDQTEIEQMLLIYCPNMLFPFIRKIVSNSVMDGGFAPLMLEPINFSELYQKRSAEKPENNSAN
jgi:preprotein translocase subunit SecB